MNKDQAIELHAAQSILERGIRAKVRAPFFLRWVGIKTVPVTIRKLYAGTLFRVSAYYLETGIKDDQLKELDTEEALEVMARHGNAIFKCIACAVLNGKWRGKWLTKPLANYLKENMSIREAAQLLEYCLLYHGTADFMNITRYVRKIKITDPSLGQKEKKKGS